MCENCNSKKFEIIRERVHIWENLKNNNLFCYFPFVICAKCSLFLDKMKNL